MTTLRRLFLIFLIAMVPLAASSAASASGATVTITAAGYVPQSSSIATGDAVQFMNADLSIHQIVFAQKTGYTCSPSPLVLQPGSTGFCIFSKAGKYSYSDPLQKSAGFKGKVTVTTAPPPPLSVSIGMTPGIVIYGHSENLFGTVSDHTSGTKVQIYTQSCGAAIAASGTATTTTGGNFSFGREPLNKTSYTVKVKTAISNAVLAQVKPSISLTKLSTRHFSVLVEAAASFAGTYVVFEKYSSSLGRWVYVQNVTLRTNPNGAPPTVLSSNKFTSTISRGLRVRAVLGQKQAVVCYHASVSNTVTS